MKMGLCLALEQFRLDGIHKVACHLSFGQESSPGYSYEDPLA